MEPAEGIWVGDLYASWAAPVDDRERANRRQLIGQLPTQIFDAHAHANGARAVVGLSPFGWTQTRSSFPTWSVADSARMRWSLYGDRDVARLWIAQPYAGIDQRKANAYLLEHRPPGDQVALCGLPDDPRYTCAQLETGRYAALKMYPFIREPPFTRISEYFPQWACRAATAASVPLILHVPSPLHQCIDEVVALARDHPHLIVILAHLGRESTAHQPTQRAFQAAAMLPNLAADTSMARSHDVHLLALDSLGPDRVLFGSDEPFNLLRYAPVADEQRGTVNVPPRPYHWIAPDIFQRHHLTVAHAEILHFQVLGCILAAVNTLHSAEKGISDKIFFQNAQRLFGLSPLA
jgi:predicted TIM-barrel fold metal-dependent hydrolase